MTLPKKTKKKNEKSKVKTLKMCTIIEGKPWVDILSLSSLEYFELQRQEIEQH